MPKNKKKQIILGPPEIREEGSPEVRKEGPLRLVKGAPLSKVKLGCVRLNKLKNVQPS